MSFESTTESVDLEKLQDSAVVLVEKGDDLEELEMIRLPTEGRLADPEPHPSDHRDVDVTTIESRELAFSLREEIEPALDVAEQQSHLWQLEQVVRTPALVDALEVSTFLFHNLPEERVCHFTMFRRWLTCWR